MGEGHGPCPHPTVQAVVVGLNGLLHHRHRFFSGRNRKVQRVGPVRHMPPNDYPATRLLISLHAGVQVLGAAGVQKASGAVFQEFGYRQERGVVLLLFGRLALEFEHVGQVAGPQVVRENAPGGVGVADVHVAVAEAGSHHHLAAIDNPVRHHRFQFSGFANLQYALAFDDDCPVLDDSAFRVHGEYVFDALYLQRGFGHNVLTSNLGNVGMRYTGFACRL